MDFVDVEYTEVQDEPITDTWYTCPACGCLNHSGSPCDCGYDPRRAVSPKKRRKRRPLWQSSSFPSRCLLPWPSA